MNDPDKGGDLDLAGNKVVVVLGCTNVDVVDSRCPGRLFLPDLCTCFVHKAFAVVVGENCCNVDIVVEAVDIAGNDPNCMNGTGDFEKVEVEEGLDKFGLGDINFDLGVGVLDIYPDYYNGYCDRHMEDFCMTDFDPVIWGQK